ncbi:MAG: DUF4159 domain-containing protein, partial [Pirellulales bacterium]|nr:DUF4159 domain-containing protein [Pirellulales bacterium]
MSVGPLSFSRRQLVTLAACAIWLAGVCLWRFVPQLESFAPWLYHGVLWAAFLQGAAVAGACLWSCRGHEPRRRRAVQTAAYLPLWQLLVFAAHEAGLDGLRAVLANWGLAGLFLIGLAWVVWGLELASRHYHQRRLARHPDLAARNEYLGGVTDVPERVWNPLDLAAWYYGRRARRLNQSITALALYALAFTLLVALLGRLQGCRELYEMPAGGGKQTVIAQTVKVQKVIRKKYVINRFSSIIFNPPPIDEVKLQLVEQTAHQYAVGYGAGSEAGFSGGTQRGKVRFIRLKYDGGDWDQDFGVGADLNMLIEYGIRTGHKVHDQTEARTVAQLANFPLGKSPPFVYMTGQQSISLSKSEIAVLREYLVDKHGMLFCDNGGSSHFHNQFFALIALHNNFTILYRSSYSAFTFQRFTQHFKVGRGTNETSYQRYDFAGTSALVELYFQVLLCRRKGFRFFFLVIGVCKI